MFSGPPFDPGFSSPQSFQPSVPSGSESSYNEMRASDDLAQISSGSAVEPSTNIPQPMSNWTWHPDSNIPSAWSHAYAPDDVGQQPQLVHSISAAALQCQPPGYYPIHPQGFQPHEQTFTSVLPTHPSVETTGHYVNGNMATQNTVSTQFIPETTSGISLPTQGNVETVELSGSFAGAQCGQRTYFSSPEQGPFTTIPIVDVLSSSLHPMPMATTRPRRSSPFPSISVRRRSPVESHRLGHAPDTRPYPSRHSRNAPCCWGGFCGTSLDALPNAAISHHLKDIHMNHETWDGRARIVCQWTSGGSPCGMEMYYDNIGKHIAAVHLGSTALSCPYCDKTFSRGDSLSRHVREACRYASQQQ